MHLFRNGITRLLLIAPVMSYGQSSGFDSFISRISEQYQVDVAIAPELISTLDSIRNIGTEITSVEELLHKLLTHSGITYQIIDGNKLMLRREEDSGDDHRIAILSGTILDDKNGEPLAFATIVVPGSNAACNTDEEGRFILPVRDTSGNVQINYLGYQPLSLPVSTFLNTHKAVRMKVHKIPLHEITVIVPYKLMVQDPSEQTTELKGYTFITEEQLLSWNAERLITSLTTYTHFSSDQGIRIRGSEAVNSLILMDEIPVYNPYHFYNIFSPFNGHYFSNVQIYKNNLPIEHGGRIDGMIDLKSKRDQPRTKLILDTDLLQSSLTTELVLSPKIYLKAGGRVSHTGILNDALSDSSVTNFKLPGKFKDENEWATSQRPRTDFYDFNLGMSILAGKKSEINFDFFESRDQLDNTTSSDFEIALFNQEILSVQQNYASKDIWKNRGYSAGFVTALDAQTKFHVQVFQSIFDKNVTYTSFFKEVRPEMTRSNTNSGFQQSDFKSKGLKSFIEKGNKKSLGYTLGISAQVHHINFVARENALPYLMQMQREREASVFGELSNSQRHKFIWTIGSRLTYLESTENVYPLPSLRVNYNLNNNYNLRAGFSKNLQSVHELTVEDRFGRELGYLVLSEPEENYPVLQSDKYMIGAGYTSTHLSLDAEIYYKTMSGLTRVRPLRPDPSFGMPTSPSDFYMLLSGEGRTSGVDITILYKKKKVEASVLYTLSKMTERYDLLFNGDYFLPQEDRRHQLKAAGALTFGKFQTSTLLTYKSKSPYLSLIRLEGRDGIEMVDQAAVQRYLPPYFSLDLGVDFSFSLFKQPALIGISIINATNHENINDLQHLGKVTREGGGGLFLTSQTELLARTANVHFRYLIQ